MKLAVLSLMAALFAVAAVPRILAQEPVDGFVARQHTNPAGETMLYRLFIPLAYERDRSYPLVVFLHGGSGLGTDNLKQISGSALYGTHAWTSQAVQSQHPAFVLAPQVLPNSSWGWGGPEASDLSRAGRLMLEIVESLQREFSIDPTRLYLTGQSLGGYGTWDIIVRRPGLFAAAVPLCGEGIPAAAEKIKDMPIWAFHGSADETVSVEGSRQMVAALRKLGSKKVRYTEYAGAGHSIWERAYAEPELADWLFAQRRSR